MNKNTRDLAVIVVDMQDFFLKNVNQQVKKELFKNQVEVLNWASKRKVPIIFLEYGAFGKSRGKTVALLVNSAGRKDVTILTKYSNGGFTDTGLDAILSELGVKRIILTGINANGCVQDTAMGAIYRNYQVVTALGLIANSYQLDIGLSANNKRWYQINTRLFESTADLKDYLR